MGKTDWDIVTNYSDVVTTTLKTVTFPKVQEKVYLRNQGNANITYTIGSQSGTLTPGQSVTVNQDVSSFTLQAASGTHTFELRANEKGTEINEIATDVTSQLLDKVGQSDLSETGRKIKVVACVIRNDGTGWKFISTENGDGNHSHINVLSVSNDTSKIVLNFSFTAKNILSFVASPDETFAQSGIFCGASVGTNYANIVLAQQIANVGGYIYYDGTTWQINYSTGISSVSFSGGVLTVTHNAVGGYMANATSRDGAYNVALGSITNTTTQIKFLNPSGTLITTPDTNMKVYFHKQPIGTGISTLNPQTTNIAGSNIWCLGVFEV